MPSYKRKPPAPYESKPCVLLAAIGNDCNRCPHYIKNPEDKPICFKENKPEIRDV